MTGRRKGKKIETWLSKAEFEIVKQHMIDASAESASSYARLAMLAGVPAQQMRTDAAINDLALAVNRLSRCAKNTDDEGAKLVPVLRALVRRLQKSQAAQRVKNGGQG